MPDGTALLTVEGLQAWYGESHVLHGVTFQVMPGEVVTLLGRNGAGKTTTLKSIMGIVSPRIGSVRFEGRELISRSSDVIARAGIALCPEERGIFASLNVKENLLLPPEVKSGGLGLATDRVRRGLEAAGVDPGRRAETLTIHEFGQVVARLF